MLVRNLSLVATLAFFSPPTWADAGSCPVTFDLDASHALLLSNALQDGELTRAEIQRFIEHPYTTDVIRKTRSFGLDVDETMLAGQLAMLGAGTPIEDISFGLGRYNERRASTAELLNSLENALPAFMASICDRLAPLVPAASNYTQTVIVVSAVNSTGFTFDDPTRIYLVAEAFRGDQGGFADIVVHESYHGIQAALTVDNPDYAASRQPGKPAATAMQLLANTILEGTATYAADPIEAGNEGAMREFQYRLARRYRRDMPGLFVLFDTTLYRAYHDESVSYDDLVGIGLQGNEGFYHLGAYMARVIAEADGKEAIPTYFQASPVAFFERYMELTRGDTNRHPRFAVSTRNILDRLQAVR